MSASHTDQLTVDLNQQQQTFTAALQKNADTIGLLPLLIGEAGSNEKRIALYRGNVIANVHRALIAIYPVLQQIVGEAFFTGLVRAFWQVHPPTVGDWNQYGEQLSSFIASFEHAQHLPYLGDVARLEWAVHQAANAADESPHEIREEPRVLWLPGTQILISSYPIADLWLAHQSAVADELSERLTQMEWSEQGALVFREGFSVKVAALPVDEAQVLIEHQIEHQQAR